MENMMDENKFETSGYRLPLNIEQMEDGSYMATSPNLNGLLVLADSIEEAVRLAPAIAKDLIAAMREMGVEPKVENEVFHFPVRTETLLIA
jgi:predicted RNase H-like HicB family nuclease